MLCSVGLAADHSPVVSLSALHEYSLFWRKLRDRLRTSGVAERFRMRVLLSSMASPQSTAAEQSLLEDDMACRLVLPGTNGEAVFVGSPPRWKENPTGNPEFVWELNRMKHWPRLARAYALTGKSEYAAQILSEMDDWIAQNPVPAIEDDPKKLYAAFYAETPWRSLEVGLRMESTWPTIIEALADSPLLTTQRLERIVRSCEDHGKVLFHVCPVFWPKADHNHYLTENAGLFRLALLFPELPESQTWLEHARRELTRCAEAQLTEDGGQIEGCPHYHNICLRTFAEVGILAREHNVELPEELIDRLQNALTYTLHTYRPSGTAVPLGDSDASAKAPLITALTCALAFDRWAEAMCLRSFAPPDAWKAAVAELVWSAPDTEKWLARNEHLDAEKKQLPRANWQQELGQAMMRSDWTSQAASVAVTCRTPVNNGHAHIDPASFDFTAFGRPLVVDPGRFTYAEIPARCEFKSATWHNTITINGREPFEYVNTWSFGPQRKGTIRRVLSKEGWQAAECYQENFAPAHHHRLIILLDESRSLVVIDALSGLSPTDAVQLWFHLDSTAVQVDESTSSAETHDAERANVLVRSDPQMKLTTHPGRISDVTDVARDSTRLCFADAGGAAQRFYATLLLPRAAQSLEWPGIAVDLEQVNSGIRARIREPHRTRAVSWNPEANTEVTIPRIQSEDKL
jgi:hypothetical protein